MSAPHNPFGSEPGAASATHVSRETTEL
ncbi:MAG: hypothetical protein QOG75_758, partial [Mycobacterium sp.]|nr:hypothetical protein [Mycobacterium sp.]